MSWPNLARRTLTATPKSLQQLAGLLTLGLEDQSASKSAMVDLLRRYSNCTWWAKGLERLPKAIADGRPEIVCDRKTKTRLSDSQVTALVDGYLAGETMGELAARFGIHRTTVASHLRRKGVSLRRTGLDAEGVAQAVRLYKDGWSVARIGERLGVNGTTAWTAIKSQGVLIRDTQGRDR